MKMEKEYENEQWKDISQYEGYYQISNYGRVKSLDRIVPNRYGIKHTGERILKVCIPKDNRHYPYVILSKNGQIKNMLVHRMVAKAFLPNNDINKSQVNHKDENKLNNKVDNLEWCTPHYNLIYNDRHLKVAKNTTDCKKWKKVYCQELKQDFRSIRPSIFKN